MQKIPEKFPHTQDTETDFPGAEEQGTGDSHMKSLPAGYFGREGEYLEWLEADLAAADAARRAGSGRPWLIAGGHRPYGEVRATVESLFEKYGVDIYFAGHSHSYSRSVPAVTGRVESHHAKHAYVTPTAPTWVTVGGAGCDEMEQGHEMPPPGYTAPIGAEVVSSSRYAIGVLGVTESKLSWRYAWCNGDVVRWILTMVCVCVCGYGVGLLMWCIACTRLIGIVIIEPM